MNTEQRQAPRKLFKTRAMLAADDAAPMMGRTTDLAASGVSVTMPQPVGVGQSVKLRFDLLVEGTVVPINTRARTQYCILSHGEFKVGCQFVGLDAGATAALSRFLR